MKGSAGVFVDQRGGNRMNRKAERLREAAADGSLENMEKLLRRGALQGSNLLFTDQELETMEIGGLKLLVDHGHDLSDWLLNAPGPAVRALMLAGLIDTPCACVNGWPEPALHFALARGIMPLVAVLIACGADVDHPDAIGRTPLCSAILYGRPEAVGLLRRHGARARLCRYGIPGDPDPFGPSGAPIYLQDALPLGYAVGRRDDGRMIGELLSMITDPNACDGTGSAALHIAAFKGHAQSVRALLEDVRVDPGVRDTLGRTPYELTGSYEIRGLLARAGSPLPPGERPHGLISMAALRCATNLRGVVFPFGFGPGEVFHHADLQDCDLSRTALTLDQLFELESFRGVALPAGLEVPEQYGPLFDSVDAPPPAPLPCPNPAGPYGLPCRRLRAAGRTIVYRPVHRLEHLTDGPSLELVDLRPLAGALTPEILSRYQRFTGVIFPPGLDLKVLREDFLAGREFFYCDFSEMTGFPSYAWVKAGAMIGARCPPGIDFQQVDFQEVDLTDTDFSLQIPILWIDF
jgi:ankyrin repeat protein